MRVYTDIRTLKSAYDIMEQAHCEDMLELGKPIGVNEINGFIQMLLKHDLNNDFCRLVTRTDVDFDDMELSEVGEEVMRPFFLAYDSQLNELLRCVVTPLALEETGQLSQSSLATPTGS